jgi:hypothetical protein
MQEQGPQDLLEAPFHGGKLSPGRFAGLPSRPLDIF